jgi:hypothetical protein
MANELTLKLTVKSSGSATQDFQNSKKSCAGFIGSQIYELMREERANNCRTNWMRIYRADIGHAVAHAHHWDAARTKVSQRCPIGDGLHSVTALSALLVGIHLSWPKRRDCRRVDPQSGRVH